MKKGRISPFFSFLAGWLVGPVCVGEIKKTNCGSKHNVMTNHHTKFQLDSSKRSQVIPLQKKVKRQRRRRQRRRHPPGLNYSPRRKVFRRGQKEPIRMA